MGAGRVALRPAELDLERVTAFLAKSPAAAEQVGLELSDQPAVMAREAARLSVREKTRAGQAAPDSGSVPQSCRPAQPSKVCHWFSRAMRATLSAPAAT
jgi:hypothetical protein